MVAAHVNVGTELVPDKNGIMMYNYGGSVGVVYNPKVVAQRGIMSYGSYQKTGDSQARKDFVSVADWLLGHSAERQLFALAV